MEQLSSRRWQMVLAAWMRSPGSFEFHLLNLDRLIMEVMCEAEAGFTFSESAIKAF